MSVRDEDIQLRSDRRHSLDMYPGAVDVPAAARQVIADHLADAPPVWTARLVWEDLRDAGHADITENMVATVMQEVGR